jgi:hypothetical protein
VLVLVLVLRLERVWVVWVVVWVLAMVLGWGHTFCRLILLV